MADISQVKLPNGDTYNLVDETSGYIKRFLITISHDDNTDSYSADKTFAEITNAYNNDYELVCHCIEDDSYVPFLAWNNKRIQFELSAMNMYAQPMAEYISISNENVVTHQFLSFTETDPVFSASAAGGITSTDISNWNGKSDTDEKLKTTLVTQTSQKMYPIFGLTSTTEAENKLIDTNFTYLPQSSSVSLTLGSSGGKAGLLELYNGTGYIILHSSQLTSGVKNIYLPAQDGTVALTSDIPTVYNSSTNPNGYLTLSTLPIYDGTVV